MISYWIAAKFLNYLSIFRLDLIHLQTRVNAKPLLGSLSYMINGLRS
jgi:hypothetical protein